MMSKENYYYGAFDLSKAGRFIVKFNKDSMMQTYQADYLKDPLLNKMHFANFYQEYVSLTCQ